MVPRWPGPQRGRFFSVPLDHVGWDLWPQETVSPCISDSRVSVPMAQTTLAPSVSDMHLVSASSYLCSRSDKGRLQLSQQRLLGVATPPLSGGLPSRQLFR